MVQRTVLSLLLLLFLLTGAQAQESQQQLRSKIDEVQQKIEKTRGMIQSANEEERLLAKKLYYTREQQHGTEFALQELKENLLVAQKRLQRLEESIKQTEKRLAISQVALERRLRQIHEHGDVSYLGVLFQSTSFTDFINQTEYLQRVVETDSKLIQKVRKYRKELEHKKRESNKTLAKMVELKEVYQAKLLTLQRVEQEQRDLIAQLQSKRRQLDHQVEDLEHISKEMDRKLKELILASQTPTANIPLGTGDYIYPVNAVITSPYGYRVHPIRGTTRLHTGIDFGVATGTPIMAADNGVVIYSGWYGGYGNTIILQHDSVFTTLYAHCNALYAHNGQVVRQGETIAGVGSTGMSTGPHLHFEVRSNGVPINPMSKL